MPAGPCEYLRAIDRSAVELGRRREKKNLTFFFKGGQGRSGVSQEEEEQKQFYEDHVGEWDRVLLRRNRW